MLKEKNSYLVSIISPVYNGEKYINEYIISALNQSYENFELILVDDGSKDKTKQIINKYMKKDKRIKYFYQKNKGAPAARNLGIEKAIGNILYIPDSDDIILKDTLKLFVDEIKKGNDIVIGSYNTIDEKNNIINPKINGFEAQLSFNKTSDFMFVHPFPGNKCYRREIIKDNVRFADVRIAQDLNFYLKTLIYAKNVSYIDQNVYSYRIVPNSISRSYSLKILEIEKSINDVEKFYRINQADEEFLNKLEFVRLIHYYNQLTKISRFTSKEDKKIVYNFFKNKFFALNLEDKDLFPYFKSKYHRYQKRLKYDFIISSKLYQNYLKKIIKK